MNKEKEIERMVQIAYNYSKEFANTPYYKGVYTDMVACFTATPNIHTRKVIIWLQRLWLGKMMSLGRNILMWYAGISRSDESLKIATKRAKARHR